MISSISLIRLLFIIVCTLFATSYATTQTLEGFTLANFILGLAGGLIFSLAIIVAEFFLKQINLRIINTVILGLIFGYFLGEAVLLVLNAAINIDNLSNKMEIVQLIRGGLFLFCIYIGMVVTAKTADEIYLSIPFIRLKPSTQNKKDIIVDSSALYDPRIVDLAVSGLLDHHLVIPRFLVKELNSQLESPDENIKMKARRCLETLKKLENIPTLEVRYSDTDFAELKDAMSKLIRLARMMDANIITADISRVQQALIEGIRFINIHLLSNALKPLTQTGEFLTIKVLRYGKEPGQGVGYLDDGTMVVVNGGAEFINETIRAQVISVKNNPTGRMIFCNAVEENLNGLPEPKSMLPELETTHKNYFAL
jgi:uncharacterized protein YacL